MDIRLLKPGPELAWKALLKGYTNMGKHCKKPKPRLTAPFTGPVGRCPMENSGIRLQS